jgi:hypothetical protein
MLAERSILKRIWEPARVSRRWRKGRRSILATRGGAGVYPVVLRLIEEFRRNAPQFLRADARWEAASELLTVDQPVRLGIGTDEGGR